MIKLSVLPPAVGVRKLQPASGNPAGSVALAQRPRPGEPPGLSFENLLRLLTRRHALRLLHLLATTGPRRFTQLQADVDGLAPKTLSAHLGQLVKAGLVSRHVYGEAPPRVEYAATERARTLLPLYGSLYSWHLGQGGEPTPCPNGPSLQELPARTASQA